MSRCLREALWARDLLDFVRFRHLVLVEQRNVIRVNAVGGDLDFAADDSAVVLARVRPVVGHVDVAAELHETVKDFLRWVVVLVLLAARDLHGKNA